MSPLLFAAFAAASSPSCRELAVRSDGAGRPVVVAELVAACEEVREARRSEDRASGDPALEAAVARLACDEAAIYLDASGFPRVHRGEVRLCLAGELSGALAALTPPSPTPDPLR